MTHLWNCPIAATLGDIPRTAPSLAKSAALKLAWDLSFHLEWEGCLFCLWSGDGGGGTGEKQWDTPETSCNIPSFEKLRFFFSHWHRANRTVICFIIYVETTSWALTGLAYLQGLLAFLSGRSLLSLQHCWQLLTVSPAHSRPCPRGSRGSILPILSLPCSALCPVGGSSLSGHSDLDWQKGSWLPSYPLDLYWVWGSVGWDFCPQDA